MESRTLGSNRGSAIIRGTFCLAVAALALVPALHLATAQEKKKPPITAQAQRGRELFQKSPKGTACGTCHTMDDVGTAVGPDLRTMASLATPRALVSIIRMTITQNVQDVKTSAGNFPGIQKQKEGEEIEIWDLSQTPPVLRKLASKDVLSMTRDDKWKHPPTSAGYTSQELADIIGFLKWAATGSRSEVKAADIED